MLHRIVFGILSLLAIFAIWTCQPVQLIQEQEQNEKNIPEDLWLSDNFQTRIDSIARYYDAANQKLTEGDTLGAEIYFNSALNIFTELSEEDLQVPDIGLRAASGLGIACVTREDYVNAFGQRPDDRLDPRQRRRQPRRLCLRGRDRPQTHCGQ